jgi:hypothetical protein
MTRTPKAIPSKKPAPPTVRWLLQEVKARFNELVRRVHGERPRHVVVGRRQEMIVVAADEFRRLTAGRTGAELIAALQASPYRDADIETGREQLPVRDARL